MSDSVPRARQVAPVFQWSKNALGFFSGSVMCSDRANRA